MLLKYLRSGYNNAALNERTIEIPLAQHFLSKYTDVIEVGAVTPYYMETMHVIVDLVDPLATLHCDANDVDITGHPLLCISSLEHFGFGDFSRIDTTAIPRFLKKVTKNYLITVPLGYNPLCDTLIKTFPVTYYTRIDAENHWTKIDSSGIIPKQYGKPFPWANTVAVISDDKDYHNVRWEDESL